MHYCTNCGNPNNDAEYCIVCGMEINEITAKCPDSGYSMKKITVDSSVLDFTRLHMSRSRIGKAVAILLVFAFMVSLLGCEKIEDVTSSTITTEESILQSSQILDDSKADMPLDTELTESVEIIEEIPEAYKQILDLSRYLLIPRTEYVDSMNTFEPYIGINEIVSPGAQDILGSECYLDEFMYSIIDMDGNGIEELVIFDTNESENNDFNIWDNRIVNIYTLDGEEAVLVASGWARNRFYLLNNGQILRTGSSGAAFGSLEIYDWSTDGLSLVLSEKYYSDHIDYTSDGEPDFNSDIGWFYTTNPNDGYGNRSDSEYIGEFDDFEYYYSMIIGFENAKPFSTWNHTYEFFVDDVTWETANQMCQDNGGHLVTIESENELQTLTTLMSWYGFTSNIYCVGGLNVGDENNGTYVWRTDYSGTTDTDVTIDASLWITGEPSLTGLTEDGRTVVEPYVAMLYSDSQGTCFLLDVPSNLLDAAPSYSGHIGYICEFE